MPDDVSRRQLVRKAALLACLPALGRAAAGCARRIATDRAITVAAPITARKMVSATVSTTKSTSSTSPSSDHAYPGPGTAERPKPRVSKRAIRKRSPREGSHSAQMSAVAPMP